LVAFSAKISVEDDTHSLSPHSGLRPGLPSAPRRRANDLGELMVLDALLRMVDNNCNLAQGTQLNATKKRGGCLELC
jgi:hypothetical protein